MIHWVSRICETCKYWIKDENKCPYQGNLDRLDRHGNNMVVIDCTCYEARCCSNCKHRVNEFAPCCNCHGLDEWEAEE